MEVSNLKLVFIVLIFVCEGRQDDQIIDTGNQLTPLEISKVYSSKIIEQYSGIQSSLDLLNFVKLLNDLEAEISPLNSSEKCINGLKFFKEIEETRQNDSSTFSMDVDHMILACPILLHHVASKETLSDPNSCEKPQKPTGSVWFYSTVAIIGISLCGLLGVAVIPIVEKTYYFNVLQFFMALAVGTLTGDALLHLLPHAMRPLTPNISKPDFLKMMMHRGVAALSGIFLFFAFERVVKAVISYRNKSSRQEQSTTEKLNAQSSHGHSHGPVDLDSKSLSSIVWMVILGDGLHNFTDGMAIGAAFSNNIAGGFSTTFAVFCHELPHELGDFAILLKAGMSARKAIFYNILSSVLSFFGMCAGIVVGDAPEATQWIFAAAAGLFIYIALVDMIPEMTSSQNEGKTYTVSQFFVQFAGMTTGFGAMLLIAMYEDVLEQIFTS